MIDIGKAVVFFFVLLVSFEKHCKYNISSSFLSLSIEMLNFFFTQGQTIDSIRFSFISTQHSPDALT